MARAPQSAPAAEAWELPAWLVVVEGESEGLRLEMEAASTIGRDPENTIRLLDERASRHHAVLRRSDGAWTLDDLGSANGTWLANERITKPWRLSDGDEFRVGNTVFRFEWDGAPTARSSSVELADRSSIRILASARGSVELGEGDTDEASVSAAAASDGDALLASARAGGRRLEVLLRIQKALSELREMEDLAGVLLDELFRAVPAHRGALLVTRADHQLEPVAIRRRDDVEAASIRISRSLLRAALSRREAVMTGGDVDAAELTAGDVRSAITAPLVYQGRLLGVLHLESPSHGRRLDRDDLDLVAMAASQAAIAVANTRLLERVRREAEHRANLERYLAPGLVEQLLEGGVGLETEGASRQCTLLFADLRGFTALSESLPSKEVFGTLNAFFQRMVDVIHAHRGSVDKFIGDAVMAVWGIPDASDDDAARAVLAAIRMQQELAHLNLERETAGRLPLAMGIGVHTGPVLAGNLGARQRLEYAVIGDTVNLASRIEGLAGAGHVLVSEATMAWVRPLVHASERPAVRVKGKRDPVKTFAVHGLRDVGEERSELGRTHPRHKTAARVVLHSDGSRHEALLADWSSSGAGVRLPPEQMRGLEVGALVRTAPPGTAEADRLEGMVVRLILVRDHAGQALFKAGIRFTDPPKRVDAAVHRWLEPHEDDAQPG